MPCVAEVVNRSLKADCTDFIKMFMLWFNCNFRPIEKDGWVDNCTFLLGKDNLNGLFVYVRIKLHLPLVSGISPSDSRSRDYISPPCIYAFIRTTLYLSISWQVQSR